MARWAASAVIVNGWVPVHRYFSRSTRPVAVIANNAAGPLGNVTLGTAGVIPTGGVSQAGKPADGPV